MNPPRDKYTKWLDGVIDSLVSKKRPSPPENRSIKTTRMSSFRSPKSKFKSLNVTTQSEGKNLSPKDVIELCNQARDLFLKQPMLLELSAPMTVCGDLHGQYQDLFRIFDNNGFPPQANYLFLGDYVDRGKQSVETACLLFALKLKYPENFFLLRGNHEASGINRIYGFYDECKRKYSVKVYRQFCSTFDCLPCCAIIDNRIICMHGGLSPHLDKNAISSQKYKGLDKIRHIQRPCDVPDEGLLCDLLWSDPDPSIEHYETNDRGVSYVFGREVVNTFLRDNDLDLIVRAHQVVEDGYEFFAGRELVTIFSAPNYCGEFDNAGATMTVDESLMCSFQIMKPVSSIKTRIRR